MGIYDLCWVDDSSLLTCSADNLVKKWSLDSDTAVKEYDQVEKRDIPRQLFTVRSLGDEGVLAVNLSGDICRWANDGSDFSSKQRHKDLLGALLPVGKAIWYTSENSIFRVSEDHQIVHIPASHKQTCDRLSANSWAVFSSGFDKLLCRFEDEKEVQQVTLPNKALCMSADENHVYVLTFSSDLLIIDGRNLSIKLN